MIVIICKSFPIFVPRRSIYNENFLQDNLLFFCDIHKRIFTTDNLEGEVIHIL